MAVEPTCYRVADLAERWSCSHSKIRTLLRDGVLPTLQLGTMLRIPIAAVVAYEAQCQADFESPSATPGTSMTPGVVSLRDTRAALRQKRP